jgi:hypothetical protein
MVDIMGHRMNTVDGSKNPGAEPAGEVSLPGISGSGHAKELISERRAEGGFRKPPQCTIRRRV